MGWFIAVLAALGAYFLCAGAALTVLMPLQYSLPMFGTIDYGHPLVTVLAIVTALGGVAAAAVASSFGGVRALLAVVVLWLAGAASVIAPFVAEGPRAWIPPSDLSGLMTATALTISELIALPAMLAGALLAKRYLRVGASPPDLLAAAGAYYVAASLMALATPRLDPRLTLPFTAGYLPADWHALVTAVPGFVAGVFVAPVGARAWRPAAIGAVVGLAGAVPIELAALLSPIRPYWPVSLVGVPVATAALVTAGTWLRDGLTKASWPRRVLSRPATAAFTGAAGAVLAIAAWALFAAMPTPYDQVGSVQAYQRTGDERKIVTCLITGRGDELRGSSTREDQATVTVTVRLRRAPSWYFSDLVGISLPVVVVLRDPLGSRTVLDQGTGQPVREVSSTAGGFASC